MNPLWKDKKISILIPFLNEEDVIVNNLENLICYLQGLGLDYEIVAIDDGSTDSSFKKLQNHFKKDNRVVLVHNEINFGKGWALKTGFEFSSGDLILFLDADLELSPRHLPNFLRIMEQTESDVVIGSKMHEDSVLYYPLKRKIMSTIFYIMTRILFGLPVRDTQTGIKLFKREALEASLPRVLVKRFAFDIELLVILVRKGYKISQAPVELNFSRAAAGRIKISTAINMIFDTLSVFYRSVLLKFYDRPLGRNKKYHYTIIAFSDSADNYEKNNLHSLLNQSYENINVICCGSHDFGIEHKRLRFIRSEKKQYSERLKIILKECEIKGEYVVFFMLRSSIDHRFFFSPGRVLSLENIGAVAGYAGKRRELSNFEALSYTVFGSVFYNMSLTYRFKSRSPRFVSELPLNGLFVKKEIIESLSPSLFEKERLEHIISRTVIAKGQKLYYSPDFMVYLKFPDNLK
ncbi:MAG: glycosyltransferase family 2 protein, partial [Bacteroidetes bacterium]